MATVINSSNVSIPSGSMTVGGITPPGPTGSTKSMNMAPTDAKCIQITPASKGFADTFTMCCWAKIAVYPAYSWTSSLMGVTDDSGVNNNNLMFGPIHWGSNVIVPQLYNNTAVRRQFTMYTLTDSTPTNWHHYAITWDGLLDPTSGAGCKAYLDGVLCAVNHVYADSQGGYTNDADAVIHVGCSDTYNPFTGVLYTASYYDAKLSAASLLTLYNGGAASTFNPMEDSGDYAESLNLRSYYEPGKGTDPATCGQDRGQDASRHCTSADWVEGNLADDYPGMP